MQGLILLHPKKRKKIAAQFFILIMVIILSCFILADFTFAKEAVKFLAPLDNEMVFSKKPVMECQISVQYKKETLIIEFDYTDMTELAKINEQGFKLKPFQVIPPGDHTLTVSFTDNNNNEIVKELQFQTRHTKTFEQADSQNYISLNYTNTLKKMDDAKAREMPYWKITSSLNSQNTIAEGPWQFNFNTELQYLDQQSSIEEPQKKGLEIINYQFSGKYEKNLRKIEAALGDVYINETKNTVSGLSRRGGTLNIDINNIYASGFVVRSDQAYGLNGDQGFKFDDKDHIYGGTFGVKLFNGKIDIKSIYVKGGESDQDTSYGVWPEPAGSKGETHGFEIKTDLFDGKIMTRCEYDRSIYDSDTSDSQNADSDKAWFAGADGQINIFNYTASYDYTGLNYNTPGNHSILKDREGFTTGAGLEFDTQSISFFFEQHNDNVEDDPLLAITTYSIYGVEYSLFPAGWPTFILYYERNSEKSSDEPAGTIETNTYTDTFSVTAEYQKDSWFAGVRPSFSKINDMTIGDYDSSSKEITIYCSYTHDKFAIGPSFTWNKTKDYISDVTTDTLTSQLDFSINLFQTSGKKSTPNWTEPKYQ